MPRLVLFASVALALVPSLVWPYPARLNQPGEPRLLVVQVPLQGKLLDFTANHGHDNRLFSAVLGVKRDLYVYLPPGYNPAKRYPVIVWLHAMDQDERALLDEVVFQIDKNIQDGTMPPVVVAAPDGTLRGEPKSVGNGSFYLNTPRGGRFGDHLTGEVWPFLQANFSLRHEAQARVLAGLSMGGFAAFNRVLKEPETFGVAMGIFPPLHLRYADRRGGIHGDFDPRYQAVRDDFSDPNLTLGRFFLVYRIRQCDVFDPLYDRKDPATPALLASESPYELLDACRHRGKVGLYVCWGTKDEFNIDAHAEAFAAKAGELGIPVATERLPGGGHLRGTALKLLPGGLRWIGKQLEPWGPTL